MDTDQDLSHVAAAKGPFLVAGSVLLLFAVFQSPVVADLQVQPEGPPVAVTERGQLRLRLDAGDRRTIRVQLLGDLAPGERFSAANALGNSLGKREDLFTKDKHLKGEVWSYVTAGARLSWERAPAGCLTATLVRNDIVIFERRDECRRRPMRALAIAYAPSRSRATAEAVMDDWKNGDRLSRWFARWQFVELPPER